MANLVRGGSATGSQLAPLPGKLSARCHLCEFFLRLLKLPPSSACAARHSNQPIQLSPNHPSYYTTLRLLFCSPAGMKPRMKNHFRAHQLSIWLRLIPELHRAGMEDVIARHNLFKNHDDLDLYDGPVKPDSIQKLTYLEETLKRRGGNASDLLGTYVHHRLPFMQKCIGHLMPLPGR